ncbi:MAG: hypothetical protein ACJ79P_06700, partial [Myxococcales bacterium]
MAHLLDRMNRVWFILSLALVACGPQGTVTGSGGESGSGGGGGSGGAAVHTLKVTVTGNGSVTSTPAGIDCGTSCTASFPQGTAITLTPTPTPGSGSNLAEWSGACAGTNPCIVLLDADATVGATFVAGAPPPPPPRPPPPPPPQPPPPP